MALQVVGGIAQQAAEDSDDRIHLAHLLIPLTAAHQISMFLHKTIQIYYSTNVNFDYFHHAYFFNNLLYEQLLSYC